MPTRRAAALRRLYWRSFADGLVIIWPVISGLLLLKAVLGATVGLVEGWGIWSGIYFAFITGLTIGYGDLVPHYAATRMLAVVIGLVGVTLTGLIAALAVKAFQVIPRSLRKRPLA